MISSNIKKSLQTRGRPGEGDHFFCPGLSRNLVEFILIFEISINLAKYLIILNIFNSRKKFEEKITAKKFIFNLINWTHWKDF